MSFRVSPNGSKLGNSKNKTLRLASKTNGKWDGQVRPAMCLVPILSQKVGYIRDIGSTLGRAAGRISEN
jgi:hypothetical protein